MCWFSEIVDEFKDGKPLSKMVRRVIQGDSKPKKLSGWAHVVWIIALSHMIGYLCVDT